MAARRSAPLSPRRQNRLKDKEAKSSLSSCLPTGTTTRVASRRFTATEASKALGVRIYTIGAGTNGEVPFPFSDPFGRTVYRNVHMEYNDDLLKQIASISMGKYFRAATRAR